MKKLAQIARPAAIGAVASRRRPKRNDADAGKPPLQYFEDVDLTETERRIAAYMHQQLHDAAGKRIFIADLGLARAGGIRMEEVGLSGRAWSART